MAHHSSVKDSGIRVVVPSELKKKLAEMAAGQGKKVSALVHESIEEKLARLERKQFEDRMREAYLRYKAPWGERTPALLRQDRG